MKSWKFIDIAGGTRLTWTRNLKVNRQDILRWMIRMEFNYFVIDSLESSFLEWDIPRNLIELSAGFIRSSSCRCIGLGRWIELSCFENSIQPFRKKKKGKKKTFTLSDRCFCYVDDFTGLLSTYAAASSEFQLVGRFLRSLHPSERPADRWNYQWNARFSLSLQTAHVDRC